MTTSGNSSRSPCVRERERPLRIRKETGHSHHGTTGDQRRLAERSVQLERARHAGESDHAADDLHGELLRTTDAVLQGWNRVAARLNEIEDSLADSRHQALAQQANYNREMNDRISHAGDAAQALAADKDKIIQAVDKRFEFAVVETEKKMREVALDSVQSALDWVGMTPGLGIAADVANSAISALRGNWGEVATNLVAAIPFYGDAFAAGRVVTKSEARAVRKATEEALFNASRHADDAFRFAAKSSDEVASIARSAKQGMAPPKHAPGLDLDNTNLVSDFCKRHDGCFTPDTLVALAAACEASPQSPPSAQAVIGADVALAPIIGVALGERVVGENPLDWEIDDSLPEPDENTWLAVSATVRRNDGAVVELEVLRPRAVVATQGLAEGSSFAIVLPELGVQGVATITRVASCPPIAAGPGNVVVGRFVTRNIANLVRVDLDDGSAVHSTGNHPFWSATRGDWTRADELRPGEQLDGIAGPVHVAGIEFLGPCPAVYNLEIHRHHVYRVATSGLLVHNAGPGKVPGLPCNVSLPGDASTAVSALTNEAKDALRASAREIWQARTGRRAVWDGMDVHHRIPLEWSHLFPNDDANRVANLVGIKSADHSLVTNAWNAWRQGLDGRIPTQAEVLQQALRIDEQFGGLMKFLP